MAYMLAVTTRQMRHPFVLAVEGVVGDRSLHYFNLSRRSLNGFARASPYEAGPGRAWRVNDPLRMKACRTAGT
jgi:hypothetical protein